jgi:hypothetical protein
VWNGNEFTALEDAYSKEYLTNETVETIGYYHALYAKESWQGSEEDFEKDYFDEKKKVIYTLDEAYEKGFFTRRDMLHIAYYKNYGKSYNEEVMADFVPDSERVDWDESVKAMIEETYAEENENWSEKIMIRDCLGIYNGCVVFWVNILGLPPHPSVVAIDYYDDIAVSRGTEYDDKIFTLVVE